MTQDGDGFQAEGLTRADAPSPLGWFRRAPVERFTLPAAGAVWAAADILHAVHASPAWPALATLLAAGWAYRRVSRHMNRLLDRTNGDAARHWGVDAATVAGLAGGWLTAAADLGPMAGPRAALSLAWGTASLGGYIWLRRHEGTQTARDWRASRRELLGEAPHYGLHGSHLVSREETLLGERYELDTRGTGHLSSALAGRHTAERIAQRRGLPVSRVQVTEGAIAGRLCVSVRERDPWAGTALHPLIDPDPQFTLPVGGSILEPAVWGVDPETGDLLELCLYDRDLGGRRILVVGTTRYAGKSCLQSDFAEQVTGFRDALLIKINLSKAIEDRAWAPACHLTALGAEQGTRAQKIMDLLVAVIDIRPALRDAAVFRPGTDGPAIVLDIDEVDAAVPYIKRQLRDLMSKGGSEGITVIEAGQRGIGDWTGGRDIRPLVDVRFCGKVTSAREQAHAMGPQASLIPDMTSYGGGALGVWGMAELDGHAQSGRSLKLTEPSDLRRIAEERARFQPGLEPALAAALRERFGDLYDDLLGSDAFAAWAGSGPRDAGMMAASGEPAPPPPPSADDLDPSMPDDLERWPVHDDRFPDDPAHRRVMLAGNLDDARQAMARADAIQDGLAPVDQGKLREAARRQWKEAAAQADLPDAARQRLLDLLADGGTTSRLAAADLGVPPTRALTWLTKLSHEGLAHLEGKGRGARWLPGVGDAVLLN